MDRREWVDRFRRRLLTLIEQEGVSRAAFAERAGLDRSTLSQLLANDTARLPRAETIATIATRMQVSADWLLGLSEGGAPAAQLVDTSLEFQTGGSNPMDDRLRRWREEAVGAKIRYVPTTIPDLLKTPDTIAHEVLGDEAADTSALQREAESHLAYMRQPDTDMEACCAYQVLQGLALGENIWRGMPRAKRRAQLDRIIHLVDSLYPTFRWFLYDGLRTYSVPFTIFGPRRCAVYCGEKYIVFNATEHIRAMARHFDDRIRAAVIQPTQVRAYVKRLRATLDEG